MAFVPRTTGTRLVQVRAVTADYPLYGEVVTDPPERWSAAPRRARRDRRSDALVALDAHVGDTLQLGFATFTIAGTIVDRCPATPD